MRLGRGKRSSSKCFLLRGWVQVSSCHAHAWSCSSARSPGLWGRIQARIPSSSCARTEHSASGQECPLRLWVTCLTEVGSSERGGFELVRLCSISWPRSFQCFLSLSHAHPLFLPEGLPHSLWAPAPEMKALDVRFNQLPQFGLVKSLF